MKKSNVISNAVVFGALLGISSASLAGTYECTILKKKSGGGTLSVVTIKGPPSASDAEKAVKANHPGADVSCKKK